jgi:hypothetical protein
LAAWSRQLGEFDLVLQARGESCLGACPGVMSVAIPIRDEHVGERVGKAGINLLVKVRSGQRRADRPGASLGKRQRTGRVVRMKEPYGKGVANHPDPEPYAVSREAVGGALIGVRTGWALSHEILPVGGADAVGADGRQHSARRYARRAGATRGQRPHACADTRCLNLGDLQPPHGRRRSGAQREAERRSR